MGIRERLNQKPGLTAGVIGAAVILATVGVVMQVLASRKKFPSKLPDSFFTVDDGKTFFRASMDNVPPFDHEGKQAVHAYVFECGGKQFVGYVERYTPEAHKSILSGQRTAQIEMYGRELKKPGSAEWIKSGDLAATVRVTNVKCPDGRPAEPIEP
jgi:hypothetical protein